MEDYETHKSKRRERMDDGSVSVSSFLFHFSEGERPRGVWLSQFRRGCVCRGLASVLALKPVLRCVRLMCLELGLGVVPCFSKTWITEGAGPFAAECSWNPLARPAQGMSGV